MLAVRRHLGDLVKHIVQQGGPGSVRGLSATTTPRMTRDNRSIELSHGAKHHKVNLCWLRDHCKCSECIHPITGQKMIDSRDFGNDIQPQQAEIRGSDLRIDWLDGHKSVFDVKSLMTNFLQKDDKTIQPVYWNAESVKSLPVAEVPFDNYIADDDAVRTLFKSLFKYGFGYVRGVPATAEMAEETFEKLGALMVTHEGRMAIIGDGIQLNDISYSNAPLPLHTDMPYMMDPPGGTYLHCLERQCEGGETIIVDGFRVANDLKRLNPGGYDLLSTTLRRFEHTPPGIHFSNSFPLLNTDPLTGQLEMIRYGTLYMRELRVDQAQSQAYYDALVQFDNMLHSPEYQVSITLEAGDQVYLNNHRLIHGRTGFEGSRKLAGSSMKMDDMKSRARMLNVL